MSISTFEYGYRSRLAARPPFTELSGVTHAFLETKSALYAKLNIELIRSKGILCLKPEYIAEYLARDPAPDTYEHAFAV